MPRVSLQLHLQCVAGQFPLAQFDAHQASIPALPAHGPAATHSPPAPPPPGVVGLTGGGASVVTGGGGGACVVFGREVGPALSQVEEDW